MRSILTKSLIGALAAVALTAGTASAADVLEAKVPFASGGQAVAGIGG